MYFLEIQMVAVLLWPSRLRVRCCHCHSLGRLGLATGAAKKKRTKNYNGKIMYILSPLLFHLVCRENGSMLSLKHFLILLYGYVGSH